MSTRGDHEAIVIGASAGGLYALTSLLSGLPQTYPLPIIIVQHRAKEHEDLLENVLQQKCRVMVKQADEKEGVKAGTIYIAPANYHLMVEHDRTFSLSSDALVKYSRPSIDVLFETAADVYKKGLIGIILTGANDDGANGIRAIRHHHGLTIAQDPVDAQFPVMPAAAVNTGAVLHVLRLEAIKEFLLQLVKK